MPTLKSCTRYLNLGYIHLPNNSFVLTLTKKNNFDFIRFIAAALVIFSHCYPLLGMNRDEPLIRYTGLGTFGGLSVYTFFIISGFLITASFARRSSFFQYFLSRVLRIFPALFPMTILTIFILGPIVTVLPSIDYFSNQNTYDYLKNFFLYQMVYTLPGVFENEMPKTSVNGAIWTIRYEFLMYILVPILSSFKLLSKSGIIVILLVLFSGYIWLLGNNQIANFRFFNFRLLESVKFGFFFFSGSLFFVYRNIITLNKNLFFIFILTMILGSYTQYAHVVTFMITLPYVIIYLGLSTVSWIRNFAKKGDFSYGLYIYAWPIQQCWIFFLGKEISVNLLFLLSLTSTLFLAILSWHFTEKHFLKMKHLLYSHSKS